MDDCIERVKSVREGQDLTLDDFGERVGETRNKISNIEQGRTKIPYELLRNLVLVFGVDPRWLLTGQGEMYPEEQGVSQEDHAPHSQKELITNQRQARINAFVEHWFETMPEDEQAWLEMQLKRNIPEYENFITDKTTDGKSQKKRAG